MSDSIFAKAEEGFPSIPCAGAWVHKLAGLPPEYVVEPRVLRDESGYIKGGKIENSAPLPQAIISQVIQVLTTEAHYGDRGMGARCFFPGFAFLFGDGAERVEVLVCLECSWVVFHSRAGEQWLVPNQLGESKLKALYERLVA